MRSHVRALAVLEIAFGAIGIVIGLGVLLLFGGIAALVGFTDPSEGKDIAIPILGAVGAFSFAVMTLVSLPEILAGIGLWKERQWGRILSLIVCAFNLLNFPFGTALGIYGFWVLLSAEGAAIFEQRQVAPASSGSLRRI
jgi:hypothetical protein